MKSLQKKLKNFWENFYLVLVLIFLYAPIAVMMALSFNSSKSRSHWGGFTLQWYSQMFESSAVMDALYNTLLIAFLSALIATVLGTAAAIGINSMKKLPRSICMGVNNIPMLNSDIVTGISLMLMFIAFGVSLGFKTILLAHISFNVPYVMLSVMPKLKQTSRYTYEAALDLGAGPLQAFFKVVFPDILPGVLSGFLMAFTMSLDDFIITHFTRGAGINTLSTLIYSEVRRGIQPTMYALSTVIFVTVLALLLITNFSPSGEKAGAGKKRAALGNSKLSGNGARTAGTPSPLWPKIQKGLLVCVSFAVVAGISYTSLLKFNASHSDELYVYNWGEYIDEDVIRQFEEETGIHVVYDLFETNEEMYPVIEAGAVQYDVVCPSDYMIQRMAENGLLAEINWKMYRIFPTSAKPIWNGPRPSIREISIPSPTAGEPSEFSATWNAWRNWAYRFRRNGRIYGIRGFPRNPNAGQRPGRVYGGPEKSWLFLKFHRSRRTVRSKRPSSPTKAPGAGVRCRSGAG